MSLLENTSTSLAVVRPGDAAYDSARALWNGAVAPTPAAIARCASQSDVVAALDLARREGLRVSVRGGGHHVAGAALADGALAVDLSAMRGVEVDAPQRLVRVEGGATWGDVDVATQPHGLAVPGGVISSTGVGGLTLGGGLSWQRRRDGMTIDNLVAATVVLADGSVVRATEGSELLWALRGGGGGFGVVTEFEFRAQSLGPEVGFAHAVYPIAEIAEVARAYRELVAGAPDELTADLLIQNLPDAEPIPAELRGIPYVGIAAMWAGDPADADAGLQPVRECGTVLADLGMQLPYLGLQTALDAGFPHGSRYFWKSLYLDTFTDDVLRLVARRSPGRPSPRTLVILRHLDGAIGRVAADATAFAQRDASFLLSIDTAWDDPAQDARQIAWTREYWAELAGASDGAIYGNFASEGRGEQAAATFGPNLGRLVDVKTAYDPADVFVGGVIRPR